MFKRPLWIVCGLILLCLAGFFLADYVRVAYLLWTKPAHLPEPVLVTISPETTHITEPLLPNGYPDYATALNQRMSKGVTPDNNIVVLLSQICGPGDTSEATAQEYFRLLGVPQPPPEGRYLQKWEQYTRQASSEVIGKYRPFLIRHQAQKKLIEEIERQRTALLDADPTEPESIDQGIPNPNDKVPTLAELIAIETAAERSDGEDADALHELIHKYDDFDHDDLPTEIREIRYAWLDSQADICTRAMWLVDKHRYYSPLINPPAAESSKRWYVYTSFSDEQALNVVELLLHKAERHFHNGEIEQALEILAVFDHVAAVVAAVPEGRDYRIVPLMQNFAFDINKRLLMSDKFPQERLTAWLRKYSNTDQLFNMSGALNFMLRYCTLSELHTRCQDGRVGFYNRIDKDQTTRNHSFASRAGYNYDQVALDINQAFDLATKAEQLNINDPVRQKLLQEFQELVYSDSDGYYENKLMLYLRADYRTKSLRREMLNVLESNMRYDVLFCRKAIKNVGLLTLGVRLRLHKLANGKYPNKLEELAEVQAKDLIDPSSDQDKQYYYKTNGDGFLLYSVGYNFEDDGGVNCYEDPYGRPYGMDDIAVYTPDMKPRPPKDPPVKEGP